MPHKTINSVDTLFDEILLQIRKLHVAPIKLNDYKLLYSFLSEELAGDQLKKEFITQLRDHALITYFLAPSITNEYCVASIGKIFDGTRELPSFTDSLDSWLFAILRIAELTVNDLSSFRPNTKIHAKQLNIANSIKHFKRRHIHIKVQAGSAKIHDTKEDGEIVKRIDQNIQKIGNDFINILSNILNKNYDEEFNRYMFPSLSTDQLLPFGYLKNLALKHLRNRTKVRNAQQIATEIFNDVVHYCTLYGVQKNNPYEFINTGRETLSTDLQKIALKDQFYSFPQSSPTNTRQLIDLFFENCSLIETNLTLHIKVARAILDNYTTPEIHVFSATTIKDFLDTDVDISDVKEVLNDFSSLKADVNTGFVHPFDADKVNCYSHPLINNGKLDFLYILPSISSIGFFEKIMEIVRSTHESTSLSGEIFENAIAHLFTDNNIESIRNEKFFLKHEHKQTLGTNRHEGEVDFIIETPETIYIIEAKSKALTRNSRSGDPFSILFDITHSHIAAQNQSTIVKTILLRFGEIKFKSGKILRLNGRLIKRISLTPHEFGSMFTPTAITNTISNLYNTSISATGNGVSQKNVARLNKQLEILTQTSQPFASDSQALHTHLFETRHLSLTQLAYMLENVTSNLDFKNIDDGSHLVLTNYDDFFFKQQYLKNIKSNKSTNNPN